MADVSSQLANLVFTFSLVQNEIDKRWNIIKAHFFKIKLPELFMFGIECDMCFREMVSTIVTKPNIVTSSGEYKRQSIFR